MSFRQTLYEREINDWSGDSVLVVHFLDDDLEIFVEKKKPDILGFLTERATCS